ncbi:MAG TPA: FG-GAP-like repeat-containing protein, partial [Thermoanaerobaculia bacterium]
MKRFSLTLVLCLPVFAAPAIFRNAPAIAVAGEVFAIRTGDFTGDANLDFVTLTSRGVTLVPGNGDGTFATSVETPLPTASDLEAADLDGDGDLDLITSVVSTQAGTMTYRPYLNDGSGTFIAGTAFVATVGVLSTSGDFAIGDLNADTKPDVVICGASYFPGVGDGTFATLVTIGPCSSSKISVFDANADGDLDVLAATTSQAKLYRNDSGVFTAVPFTMGGTEVAIADLDDNGQADLTWIDSLGDRGVYLASATGTYSTRTSAGHQFVRKLTTADINGDGRPDVIGSGYGRVWVWLTAADGSAGPRTIYAAGNEANAVAVGDFDEDGDVDVLAGGVAGSTGLQPRHSFVSLLRNAGSGSLDSNRTLILTRTVGSFFTSNSITNSALSDVTGDGNLDLLLTPDADNLVVFPGDGDGGFTEPVLTPEAGTAAGTAGEFADFNGDGKTDVARVGPNYMLEVWLAQTSGVFTKSASLSANHPVILTGDFNGDDKQDVLSFGYDTIALYRGAGDGTLANPITTALQVGSLTSLNIAVGDYNGDGRDDLACHSSVILGQANGSFTKIASGVVPPSVNEIETADLDGDGKLDLIRASRLDGHAWVYTQLGNGDGTFGSARRIDIQSRMAYDTAMTCGDVDGDGHVDLAFGSTILLGDGQGAFNGYAASRTSIAVNGVTLGDLDGNGSLDVIANAFPGVTIIPTLTAESLARPLTVVADELGSLTFGVETTVAAHLTGETWAPESAVMFSLNGVIGAFAEPMLGDATSTLFVIPTGDVALTATYTGDAIYAPATSAATTPVTIARVSVTASTTLSPSAPKWSDSVRITGQLQGVTFAPVTGTIAVMLDGNPHSTVSAPAFDVNLGQLTPGTHNVVLQYSGNATYSTKNVPVTFDVAKPTATFSLNVGGVYGPPSNAHTVAAALFP